jgi:NAD(P)-dependent dehydrogenase (short-subunit alcohol dehydrogenase family)
MADYAGPYEGNEMFKSFTKVWHTKPYAQISPDQAELRVTGKVIFITGGGSGIGKATAIAFAQAGASAIAIFGRREHMLQSAAAGIRKAALDSSIKVITQSVDLSQHAATRDAFASALQQIGQANVDVYISNAASSANEVLADYDFDTLRTQLELNFMGTFNGLQAVLPLLHRRAKVIDISSGIGHIRPVPKVWLYAAIKSAATKMFTYLQAEHPELSVYSVQPGVVDTDLNDKSKFAPQDQGKSQHAFNCAKLTLDTAELPAQFQVWLASNEAEFLKGKFLWVNWDVDELKAHAGQIKDSHLLEIGLNGVPM